MGWKDSILPASFRGVPFFVDAAGSRAGRTTVAHEYPVSDGSPTMPYAEDTGSQLRRHRFDAYILSEDYIRDAKTLLDAIDEAGPGVLVHPYLGTFEAICEDCDVGFHRREGRKAIFSLTFLQTAFPFPSAPRADAPAAVGESAQKLEEASGESFSLEIQAEDAPGWVKENTKSVIDKVLETIRDVDFSFPGEQELAAFTRKVDEIGTAVVDLVRVGDLPENFHDAFILLEQAVTSKVAAIEFYLEFAGFRATNFGFVSNAGKLADRHAKLVERLFRETAIARAARLALDVEWASHDDALELRTRITDALAALEDGASDETYNQLVALQAALLDAVPPQDQALPEIARIKTRATTSTILIAYQSFGKVEKEPEVQSRNRIPWPGLVPVGREIELLVAAR